MNLLKTIKIKKCRLCNNKKLHKIFNFGNFYVSNFVDYKNIKKGVKGPLSLVYCKNCKLLQLEHSAPQELMYRRFYWYRSGVTQTMKDSLYELYADIKNNFIIKPNDLILDIGANDGTFLSYFKKKLSRKSLVTTQVKMGPVVFGAVGIDGGGTLKNIFAQ